jgi:hypothetical protein
MQLKRKEDPVEDQVVLEPLKAEPLPQPEPVEERLHRERRFIVTFIPEINDQLWDWVKQLFQDYQKATEVLTPLENNTWMADAVLQAASVVTRRKWEAEQETPVSTMMHLLQLPLFQNQTLLTQPKLDQTPDVKKNSTEELPQYLIRIVRAYTDDAWDLGIMGIIFAFAALVALIAALAGKKGHVKDGPQTTEEKELEKKQLEFDEIIKDCENCDFHLDYPLVHLPEEP